MRDEELSERIAEFEAACRAAGLKVTHQRLEVYRELLRASDHPTAETVYSRIRARLPTISLDTVYRTLATLEQHRLVSRVQTVESHARFEAVTEKHHHALCIRCGAITDFIWSGFDHVEMPEELRRWGIVTRRNATLEGICAACGDK